MNVSIKPKFNAIGLLPVLVLGLCLGCSYYLWDLAYQLAKKEQQQQFDAQASEVEILIKQRLQAYSQVLHGGRALFIASNEVSREEFKNYVSELDVEQIYPGIQGVGFAKLIPASEKETHIAQIQAEGFANYTIHPAGERSIYSSIVFIEPFNQRNQRAFGFDMYSEPVRRAAMDKAWYENKIVLSGKVKLVQEIEPNVQAGFLIYLPLYRKNTEISKPALRHKQLLGWVYAPFRMNDFMRAVLKDRQKRGFNLDIDVYDGTKVSTQGLLYNHNNDDLDYTKSAFVRVKYIEMAGHFWSIYIHSHSVFESSINLNHPYLTAFIGFAMTEMLTMITWMLVNGRQRALKLATKMNAQLLERETRYRQMFEGSCSMAVLIAPETGNIVDANPAASDFWGYSVAELRRMNISDIHTLPLDKILPILNVTLKQNLHLETQHRLSNGDIKEIEFYSNVIVYEGKMVIYAILHDITERKQQEQEIKRLSESELNKAKLEAEKANRAKSEFLSQMSHELRTPMNAVLGFAQLLALDKLTEDQGESVQHIITAGHHLMDLINQVLDLARIEAEKLELNLEEISLTFLIQNCLSLMQPLTVKNQIKLIDNSSMGFQRFVIVDKLRFKQVLLNLISNAIKYNRTAGSVTISTALIQPQRLRISITDTGNGLSKAQLAKLFHPFERLTAKNSHIEGTGIGLCISKKLTEAMDGRIGVESVEGEGSCFWIEIPCL